MSQIICPGRYLDARDVSAGGRLDTGGQLVGRHTFLQSQLVQETLRAGRRVVMTVPALGVRIQNLLDGVLRRSTVLRLHTQENIPGARLHFALLPARIEGSNRIRGLELPAHEYGWIDP